MRQSFRFKHALSDDILRSKIDLVVKKLLKFSKSLIFHGMPPIGTPEGKILMNDTECNIQ